MKLKGILDFSLGNFLCLRGFAPMGVLQDISAAPEDIQRKPTNARLKDQMVRDRITPFCLILCQTQSDYRRFSRSLFHNINHKQVPPTVGSEVRLEKHNDLFRGVFGN